MPIIPPKLQPGDEVRVIAPSRSLKLISQANIDYATKALADLSLKVTFGKHVNESDMLMSSAIASRVADLHVAFADPNVKGILTVIGGFNSNQLLPHIDYDLIRNNPKFFCGFSDITALNNAIYHKAGLINYSGVHFSTFAMQKGFEYSREYFKRVAFHGNNIELLPSDAWADDAWFMDQDNRTFHKNSGYWSINPGHAEGTIIGGNLGTLALLQGTDYMPSLQDCILFLEDDAIAGGIDVVEFERKLHSLLQQPGAETIRGLVFGRFETAFGMGQEKLRFILDNMTQSLNIPIIANADFGHTSPIFTFPVGGTCAVEVMDDAARMTLVGS